MTKRVEDRRRHARGIVPAPLGANSPSNLPESLLLASTTALLVATPLIPSEGAVPFGTIAPLALLWCLLLLAWALLLLLKPAKAIHFGFTEGFAVALVGWHALSAIVASFQGNARQSINALWLWVSYGVAFFLLRQLVRSSAQARALVAVMVALGICLAVHGYYQYFVSFPQLRHEYRLNPERLLAESGLGADPNSPQRKQFEGRVNSVEPLASFALTNSLAGYLAPWLVATLGIFIVTWTIPAMRRASVASAAIAALLCGCLLLTKSRTGILATGFGAVLILLYGRRDGWRIGWKLPASAAGIALLLGLAIVLSGGLDAEVLSEAPKSLLYRLEYWRATARIILEHPLLGCGPGSFQEHYSHYKLPQASETIADPHNFLLEIWATAGTPALLLLLATIGAFVYSRSRPTHPSATDRPAVDASTATSPTAVGWIYGGAAAGVFLGFVLALMLGYLPIGLLAFWLLGVPAGAFCLWALHAWVTSGEMPVALPVIALLTLAVNLLAAGSASFPGVFLSTWVLLAVALPIARSSGEESRYSPLWPLGLVIAAAALLVACHQTAYRPVLLSQAESLEAQAAFADGHAAGAIANAREAAAADPWSSEPWRMLAEMLLQIWLQSGQDAAFQEFATAADEYRARRPQHYVQFQRRGNWYLQAFRKSADARHLDEALAAYREAVVHFPNSAMQHAQLAWVLHLTGNAADAAREAEEALRLDGLNPHLEQKLVNQRLFDPELPDDSAKQIVENLRTKQGNIRE